jgi:hypothetical protein
MEAGAPAEGGINEDGASPADGEAAQAEGEAAEEQQEALDFSQDTSKCELYFAGAGRLPFGVSGALHCFSFSPKFELWRAN